MMSFPLRVVPANTVLLVSGIASTGVSVGFCVGSVVCVGALDDVTVASDSGVAVTVTVFSGVGSFVEHPVSATSASAVSASDFFMVSPLWGVVFDVGFKQFWGYA